jgi:hypothetical protein
MQMDTSIIEEFVKKITYNIDEHSRRFYEIFSARGFLLQFDGSAGKVSLSADSHEDDGEFLEMLQDINYKKICTKPHQDVIQTQAAENVIRDQHVYFDAIESRHYDIDNMQYLAELFTQEIPVDQFRLNWERDWYGKFEQFREVEKMPPIRVYDLEPFIARFVKSLSSIGVSTWSSCEGHWGGPAYINFDGKYHSAWFQTILNRFVKKKLPLACAWDWWDKRCSISSPKCDNLGLYLEIQQVARILYDNRVFLRNAKRRAASMLSYEQRNMSHKKLLDALEGYIEDAVAVATGSRES